MTLNSRETLIWVKTRLGLWSGLDRDNKRTLEEVGIYSGSTAVIEEQFISQLTFLHLLIILVILCTFKCEKSMYVLIFSFHFCVKGMMQVYVYIY